MTPMKFLILFLCLAASALAAPYTLPNVNQGAWTPGTSVGVVGGFDQYRAGGASARTSIKDVTLTPYFADKTGVTDATTAIQTALTAAVAGDVVYLPTGTYKTTTQIGTATGGVTIRGDGKALTIIAPTHTGIVFNIGSSYDFVGTEQTVTGTKTKGTATLTVSSSSGFSSGSLAQLFIENEEDNTRIAAGAAPRLSTYGYTEVLNPMVKVTATGSGTITIDPPLPTDCTNSTVRIVALNNPTYKLDKFGIEGLSIDGTAGPAATGIYCRLGHECWIYDVDVSSVSNYPIWFENCYKCEVHHCDAGGRIGTGSNGGAILMNKLTSSLITDSHFYDFGPLMEVNFSSLNNAICYNLFTVPQGNCILLNHGPHNMLNLYEGNVASSYKSDGYYGSCSNETIFRNWLHASNETGTVQLNATIQNRFTRQFAHVGNVFGWDMKADPLMSYGNPNIGNGSYTGDAQPTTGDFWRDWKMTGTLTTRTSDTAGDITVSTVGDLFAGMGISERGPALLWTGGARRNTQIGTISGSLVTFTSNGNTTGDVLPVASTTFTIYTGSSGFQERDLDCEASAFKTHNYHAIAAGTGAVQNSTADTIPDSLAYSAKPAWFGALTWPPVNADSPTFSLEIIPAGYRYINDAAPPEPSGPTISVSGNVTIGGTLSIGN